MVTAALVAMLTLASVSSAAAVVPPPASQLVHSIFNPNACLVKPGWNNTYKWVRTVKYRLYGDTTLREADPLNRPCPVGIWRRV